MGPGVIRGDRHSNRCSSETVKYVEFEFNHDPFVNSFVTRPLRQKFTINVRVKTSRSADGMATW